MRCPCAPGHADAHCVQGMLYSAAGQLGEAAAAFEQALIMDQKLAIAHGFAGYNAALLGRAHETLPAIDRAMRLDPTKRRHSIWFFFGGFAELLVGRTDRSIALFRKSLEGNPSYGSALLFLMAALSSEHRDLEAAQSCSLVPAALSRLSRRQLRAAVAVSVGLGRISRSNRPLVRENSRPRRRKLIHLLKSGGRVHNGFCRCSDQAMAGCPEPAKQQTAQHAIQGDRRNVPPGSRPPNPGNLIKYFENGEFLTPLGQILTAAGLIRYWLSGDCDRLWRPLATGSAFWRRN